MLSYVIVYDGPGSDKNLTCQVSLRRLKETHSETPSLPASTATLNPKPAPNLRRKPIRSTLWRY